MNEHHINDMIWKLKPVLKDAAKAKVILKRYWHARMALAGRWQMCIGQPTNVRWHCLTQKPSQSWKHCMRSTTLNTALSGRI